MVNGESTELSFRERYAQVGDVAAGDLVAMTFPISERTQRTSIGAQPYTVVIKGNEVVFIDPPGKWHPLYQRAHYRTGRTRYRKVSRFTPSSEIRW